MQKTLYLELLLLAVVKIVDMQKALSMVQSLRVMKLQKQKVFWQKLFQQILTKKATPKIKNFYILLAFLLIP